MTNEIFKYKITQHATRNTQHAIAIALTSALFLTACGGSSSSSGDEKTHPSSSSTPTTNVPSNNQNSDNISKVDKSVGVWVTNKDCSYSEDNNAWGRLYLKIAKKDDGIVGNAVKELFDNDKCQGTAKRTKLKEKVMTKEEVKKNINFDKEGILILTHDDGGNDKFKKVSPNSYPVM